VRSNVSIEFIVEQIASSPLPTTFVIAPLTLPGRTDKIAQQGLGTNRAGLLHGTAMTVAKINPMTMIF
jgi:hypothetical protein